MMTSHSKNKIQTIFETLIQEWDYSIESMDDEQNKEYVLSVINSLGIQLSDLNDSWRLKCIDSPEKLKKLSENKKYIRNQELYDHSVKAIYLIKNLYQLKNRRTKENFDLRAENAELRMELKKLKNKTS